MSTKIFNGLKIDTANIKHIYSKFKTISDEVSIIAKKNYAKQLAEMYVESYDKEMNQNEVFKLFTSSGEIDSRKRTFLNSAESTNLFYLLYEIMEYNYGVIKRTCGRNPAYDFNLEIFIYPFSENTTLLNPRYEQDGYGEIIRKYFDEYAYWNSIDRPDRLSEKEWDERCEAWDEVLNWESDFLKWELYPNQRDVFNLFGIKERDELEKLVIQSMPSIEDRAYAIVWDKECSKNLKEHQSELNSNNVFTVYSKAKKKTDSCESELRIEAKEYSKTMKEITIDILNKFDVSKKVG